MCRCILKHFKITVKSPATVIIILYSCLVGNGGQVENNNKKSTVLTVKQLFQLSYMYWFIHSLLY